MSTRIRITICKNKSNHISEITINSDSLNSLNSLAEDQRHFRFNLKVNIESKRMEIIQ